MALLLVLQLVHIRALKLSRLGLQTQVCKLVGKFYWRSSLSLQVQRCYGTITKDTKRRSLLNAEIIFGVRARTPNGVHVTPYSNPIEKFQNVQISFDVRRSRIKEPMSVIRKSETALFVRCNSVRSRALIKYRHRGEPCGTI